MIGIALAVAVLIVVLSVMNGFEYELQRRILGMVSDASITGYEGAARGLAGACASACSRATTSRPRRLTSKGKRWPSPAKRWPASRCAASTRELEPQVSTIRSVMTSGDLDELTPRSYRVVIGQQLATVLDVDVGDEIVLVLADADRDAGRVGRRAMRSFTVSGIFDAGMYEYDRGLVFTSFDDAARLFRTGGEATGLRLAIPDLYNARDVAMAAAQAARQRARHATSTSTTGRACTTRSSARSSCRSR